MRQDKTYTFPIGPNISSTLSKSWLISSLLTSKLRKRDMKNCDMFSILSFWTNQASCLYFLFNRVIVPSSISRSVKNHLTCISWANTNRPLHNVVSVYYQNVHYKWTSVKCFVFISWDLKVSLNQFQWWYLERYVFKHIYTRYWTIICC